MRPWVVILAGVAALAACSPYTPNLPAEPFLCGSAEPKCPDGYTCEQPGGGGAAICAATAIGATDAGGSGACAQPITGILATWSLVGEAGSQTSTAALSSAPGVTASPITRAAGLTPAAGIGSISSSGWPTTPQLSASAYYALHITPPSGCTLDLTALAVDAQASGTGPTSAAAATSADAFAQTSTVAANATSTPALAVSGQGGPIEIRLYGFAAGAVTGTWRIQNQLTVSGALR